MQERQLHPLQFSTPAGTAGDTEERTVRNSTLLARARSLSGPGALALPTLPVALLTRIGQSPYTSFGHQSTDGHTGGCDLASIRH